MIFMGARACEMLRGLPSDSAVERLGEENVIVGTFSWWDVGHWLVSARPDRHQSAFGTLENQKVLVAGLGDAF